MHPELFTIPFTELTVKSYGLMMVLGFLAAIYVIKHLSRKITPDPQMIINAALYSLIAGVIGARIFYVVHYFDSFRGDLLSMFAIWQGGLELLGGVIMAIGVILSYLIYHKLPVRQYLDILAIALTIALAFGRIGCFMNGCCYGKPAELPWAVHFPYGSLAYQSQVEPDLKRDRPDPYIQLPESYFETQRSNGYSYRSLIPFDKLTADQQNQVTGDGPYACRPVHPTQLYSSAYGLCISFLLFLFWRRAQKAQTTDLRKAFIKPGSTFALMFILYAPGRFLVEYIRDDNPFEFDTLTVSQNISIGLFVLGIVLMVIFSKMSASCITKNTRK